MANVESYARSFGLVIDHCQPIIGSEIAWTLIEGAADSRHSVKIENLRLFLCGGPLATERIGSVEKLRNSILIWQLRPARDHAPGLSRRPAALEADNEKPAVAERPRGL